MEFSALCVSLHRLRLYSALRRLSFLPYANQQNVCRIFPSEHCGVCVFTRLLRILHDCKLSSLFSLMLAFSFHPGLPSRKAFVWILSPVTLQPGSLYPHLVSSSFSYGPSDRLNYQHSQYGPPQSLTLFSCCLFWPQTQFSAWLCSGLCSGSDVLLCEVLSVLLIYYFTVFPPRFFITLFSALTLAPPPWRRIWVWATRASAKGGPRKLPWSWGLCPHTCAHR